MGFDDALLLLLIDVCIVLCVFPLKGTLSNAHCWLTDTEFRANSALTHARRKLIYHFLHKACPSSLRLLGHQTALGLYVWAWVAGVWSCKITNKKPNTVKKEKKKDDPLRRCKLVPPQPEHVSERRGAGCSVQAPGATAASQWIGELADTGIHPTMSSTVYPKHYHVIM